MNVTNTILQQVTNRTGREIYISRRQDKDEPRPNRRTFVSYGSDLDGRGHTEGQFTVSWYLGKPLYLVGFSLDVEQMGEPDVGLALYAWPASVYLSFETAWAKRLAKRLTGDTSDGGREVKLVVGSRMERGTIRWSLWHPIHSWSSDTPRWREGSVNLIDTVLGRRDMRWETISKIDVLIPMPEKSYLATCEMRDHVSWRCRLPFRTRRVRCADLEIPGGIGFPGKGENAWDCGDDATYAMSCNAKSVEEAIGKLVASILTSRKRDGGSYEFTPAEVAS